MGMMWSRQPRGGASILRCNEERQSSFGAQTGPSLWGSLVWVDFYSIVLYDQRDKGLQWLDEATDVNKAVDLSTFLMHIRILLAGHGISLGNPVI